jgi:hypothetical protein
MPADQNPRWTKILCLNLKRVFGLIPAGGRFLALVGSAGMLSGELSPSPYRAVP